MLSCVEQLVSLQTRLAERDQQMDERIQQLKNEHEMNTKQFQEKHDVEIERIRAGEHRQSATVTSQ